MKLGPDVVHESVQIVLSLRMHIVHIWELIVNAELLRVFRCGREHITQGLGKQRADTTGFHHEGV